MQAQRYVCHCWFQPQTIWGRRNVCEWYKAIKKQLKTHIFLVVGLEEDLFCAEEGPEAIVKVILFLSRS